MPKFEDDTFASLSRKQYWLAILVIMLVMIGLSAWAGWYHGQDEPVVSDADTVGRNDPLTTFMFTPVGNAMVLGVVQFLAANVLMWITLFALRQFGPRRKAD